MQKVQAEVVSEAEDKNTKYGDRVVVDLETEWGEDASIWSDADDPEAQFARTLSEGQTITVLKKKGSNGAYYTFTDEQIESVQGQGGPSGGSQGSPQQGGSSGGYSTGDSISMEANNPTEGAKEIAKLTAAVYRNLDNRLAEANLHNPPTSEELASMTSTIIIQAFD